LSYSEKETKLIYLSSEVCVLFLFLFLLLDFGDIWFNLVGELEFNGSGGLLD